MTSISTKMSKISNKNKNKNLISNDSKENSDCDTKNTVQVIENLIEKKFVGLKNLGNTCYINSVLQILFHIKQLVLEILEKGQDTCSHEIFAGIGSKIQKNENMECLICIFKYTLNCYYNTNLKVIEPIKIFNARSLVSDSFKDKRQQAATEFLNFLISAIQGQLITNEGIEITKENPELIDEHVNVVKTIFQFTYENNFYTYNCSHCGKDESSKSSTKATSMDLFIPAPNNKKDILILNDLLRLHFKKTAIKAMCVKCYENADGEKKKTLIETSAEKQISIKKIPKILIINLNRFTCQNKKINNEIIFDEFIDVKEFVKSSPEDFSARYKLLGLIEHIGSSINSGHYVSIVRLSPELFVYCNDRRINEKMGWRQVCKMRPLVLFYELEDENNHNSDAQYGELDKAVKNNKHDEFTAMDSIVLGPTFWKTFLNPGKHKLKKGWTDEFREKFKEKFDCPIAIKSHYVNPNPVKSKFTFTVDGRCKFPNCTSFKFKVQGSLGPPFKIKKVLVSKNKNINHKSEKPE